MGYYSTVTIIADSIVAEMLEAAIKKHGIMADVMRDEENECAKIHIDWINWFNPFQREVESILDRADELDLSYAFLRVGEEYEDVDFHNNISDGGSPIESCWPETFLDNGDLSFVKEEPKSDALTYEQKAYVCDKLCKHCHMMEQEELDQVCETCPINQ